MSEELAGLEQAFQKNLPTDLRETWCFPTSEWPRIYSVIFDAAWKVATDLAYQLSAERARADALAARVEALTQVMDEMLYQFSEPTFPGEECRQSGHVRLSTITAWRAFLNSTPAADLEAHDAKVREPLEKRIEELDGVIAKQRKDMLGSSVEAVREERTELKTQVDDLSTLIRQLVHSLNKYNPGSSTAARAMDYLKRRGIQGSILRSAESQDAHDARVRREALGTGGVEAIAAERKRQIEQEGWTPEHDDEHDSGELAAAAACYTVAAIDPEGITPLDQLPIPWPWAPGWYKPANPRGALVKAGALIAAEIDRMDRRAAILGPEAQGNEQEEK